MSAPVFSIADIRVINQGEYAGYRNQMLLALAAFGGRLIRARAGAQRG